MSSFEVLTGFWKRRMRSGANGGTGSDEFYYGKPRIKESIVINPGDELFIFKTTAKNPRTGEPSLFLKIKRRSDEPGVETTEAQS